VRGPRQACRSVLASVCRFQAPCLHQTFIEDQAACLQKQPRQAAAGSGFLEPASWKIMRARVPVLSKGRLGIHHPIQLLGGLGCGAEHEQTTYRETITYVEGSGWVSNQAQRTRGFCSWAHLRSGRMSLSIFQRSDKRALPAGVQLGHKLTYPASTGYPFRNRLISNVSFLLS